jgi:uncharacterized membrane protein YfcA
MTWEFSVTGLLIGLLVGLTGMGGGALLTPLLILVFGFKPTLAVGTDILHGAVFKTFGAARHRRLGTVHARLTFWMFVGSAPLSLVGVELAEYLERRYGDGVESAGAKVVGAALLLGSLGLVAKTFVPRGIEAVDAPLILTRRDRLIALSLGASGGFIVGLTSVGSGTFFALVMLLVFPLTAAKIVGTDIWHAAALLWVAGISHLLHGNVDLGAMGWLLLGSIPGILIGSQVTVRLPDRALRIALATTLGVSGIKLLEPPLTGPLIVLTLAIGLALLVTVEVQRLNGPPAAAPSRSIAGGLRRQRAGDERLAAEPAAELVDLAAGAEPRRGREEREEDDEPPKAGADRLGAADVSERRRA